MNEVEKEAAQLREAIISDIGDASHVVCRIPDWEPVDLAMGLRWVESSIFEGYYVAYRVDRSTQPVTLHLKNWEFGDAEPPWPQ